MLRRFLVLFILFTRAAMAFPTVFDLVIGEEKVLVSCGNLNGDLEKFKDIEQIGNFFECDNLSPEKYCECISRTDSKILNPKEMIRVQIELGLLGDGTDDKSQHLLSDITNAQKLMRMYENKEDELCFDLSRRTKGSFQKKPTEILSSFAEKAFNEKDSKNQVAYLNSRYIEKAKEIPKIINEGADENFKIAKKEDAKLLLAMAKIISGPIKGRFNKLSHRLSPTWKNDLIKIILSEEFREAHKDSPLFQTTSKVLMSQTGKSGVLSNSSFLVNLKNAVKAAVKPKMLVGDDKEEKILRQIQKNTNEKPFKSYLSKSLNTSCQDLTEDLIARSITGDKGEMNVENRSEFRRLGLNIFQELSEFPIEGQSNAQVMSKVRRMNEIKANYQRRLLEQFGYSDDLLLNNDKRNEIFKHVEKKSNSLGRYWCDFVKGKSNQELAQNSTSNLLGINGGTAFLMKQEEFRKIETNKLQLHGLITNLNEEVRKLDGHIKETRLAISNNEKQLKIKKAELVRAKENGASLRTKSLENSIKGLEELLSFQRKESTNLYSQYIKKSTRLAIEREKASMLEGNQFSTEFQAGLLLKGQSSGLTGHFSNVESNGIHNAQIMLHNYDFRPTDPTKIDKPLFEFVEKKPEEKEAIVYSEVKDQFEIGTVAEKNNSIIKETLQTLENVNSSISKGYKPNSKKDISIAEERLSEMINGSYSNLKASGANKKKMMKFVGDIKKFSDKNKDKLKDLRVAALGDYPKEKNLEELKTIVTQKAEKKIMDKNEKLPMIPSANGEFVAKKTKPLKQDEVERSKPFLEVPKNDVDIPIPSIAKKVVKENIPVIPVRDTKEFNALKNEVRELKNESLANEVEVLKQRASLAKTEIKNEEVQNKLLKRLNDNSKKQSSVEMTKNLSDQSGASEEPKPLVGGRNERSVGSKPVAKSSGPVTRSAAKAAAPSTLEDNDRDNLSKAVPFIQKQDEIRINESNKMIQLISDSNFDYEDGPYIEELNEKITTVRSKDIVDLSKDEVSSYLEEIFKNFKTEKIFLELPSGKKIIVKKTKPRLRKKVKDLNEILSTKNN